MRRMAKAEKQMHRCRRRMAKAGVRMLTATCRDAGIFSSTKEGGGFLYRGIPKCVGGDADGWNGARGMKARIEIRAASGGLYVRR